ncbi:HAD family hydrolase [Streptomyces sp. NPDC058701]|uniref:HAD family hydrolase n=1 Tax=Streptomyces sp. NPDC058701 TaxID=3346608 RepID=UPI0036533D16
MSAFEAGSSMRVAVFDIDGTLYPDVLSWTLPEWLVSTGACPASRFVELRHFLCGVGATEGVTEGLALLPKAYELFAQALAEVRVTDLENAAENLWRQKKGLLFPFSHSLMQSIAAARCVPVLISRGPDIIVRQVAKSLDVSLYRGTRFQVKASRYTGEIFYRDNMKTKKEFLFDLFDSPINLDGSMAVGNTLHDAQILELVGFPYAFEPSQGLTEVALERGWPIVDRHTIKRVVADAFLRNAGLAH